MTTAARAISIVEQNSTAVAGGTGSFEVDCFGTSEPTLLNGFSFEIVVPTDITITSADIDTAEPYIFGSVQSPPFVQSMTSGTVMVADSFPNFSSFTAVGEGEAFGMVHVDYSVAPGTPSGPYLVNYPKSSFDFAQGVIGMFSNPSLSTITVAVPEPATLGMLAVAGVGLLSRRARRT
jgi:hypothetical protein